MKRPVIIALALAGALAGAPSGAAELGVYGGVLYARADKDADRAIFAGEVQAIYDAAGFAPQSTSATFDTEDTTYGFVVGYRLSRNLAIEGGYLDLGEVSYRDRSSGVFDGETQMWLQNVDSDTSGIMLAALGVLPLSYRWEVYGRAGMLIASSEENVFLSDGLQGVRLQASKSGFDLLAGVGTSLTLVDVYSLRLEWLRVFDAGEDATLAEADVDLLTLGFTVSF